MAINKMCFKCGNEKDTYICKYCFPPKEPKNCINCGKRMKSNFDVCFECYEKQYDQNIKESN